MTRLKYFIIGTLVVSSLAIAQGYMSQLTVGNVRLTGNTVSTTNSNGDLTFDLNGTGSVLFSDLTASRALYLDASKKLTSSAVTNTELGYVSGVTSSLCGINQSCTLTGKTLTGNVADNLVSAGGGVFNFNTTGAITVPSGTDQLVARATTDTLTNKTLTGNTAVNLISGSGTLILNTSGTITIPNGGDTLVGRDTTDTLTNKTLTSPLINTPTTDIVLWDDTTTPSNPSSGFYKLYFKNDGKLYKLNPAGTEAEVGSGSGGGSSGINILGLYNHNAELGVTTFWSESGGGTLDVNSTAANVANGAYAFSFDASADGDYASSDAATIPAGLYGANCLLQFYYKGFDENVTAQVTDGSATIATQALTAASAYTTASLNFICPSSGTLEFQLLAGADAAIGYWDEVHLGSALNLSNVSQASFIGQAYFATTAGCTFTRTNTALGALADTDCPGPTVEANPGPGVIQTTDADAPIVTVNNLPPGRYKVGFVGASGTSATPAFAAASISDGTTQSGQAGINIHASVIAPFHLVGTFEYTTAGNRSFELFVSSSANAVNVHNSASDQRLMFYIYRYPLTNELAYRPDQSANSWSGYHDSTCSWARTNTAYGDPTADSTCNLVERTNVNFGTVSTYTVTNAMPGIVFTPSRAQRYFACAVVKNKIGSGSGGVQANLQLIGTGSITIAHSSQTNTGDYINTNTLCGIYPASSTSAVTLNLQSKSASGTVTIGTTDPASVEWSIFAIDQQLPAPLLVNSVVNPRSGVTNICSALVTHNGTPTITRSDGNCLASVASDNGAGNTTFNFASGTFSSAPNCTCTTYDAAASFDCSIDATTALSSTQVRIETYSSTAAADKDFFLICVGPK